MTPLPDETRKFLYAAAETVEARGWTTGVERARDGRVCLLGAMQAVAATDMRIPFDAVSVVGRYLDNLGFGTHTVACHNDHHTRGGEHAAAALRAAADQEVGQ